MTLDILTLAFVSCLIFLAQSIALAVQYMVNRANRGVKWWLLGSTTWALGVIFVLAVNTPALSLLARVANPLIVLATVLLNVGVVRFLNQTENRWGLISVFVVTILAYDYFIYIDNDLEARTLILSMAFAILSFMTALRLFQEKARPIAASASLTGAAFLAYGIVSVANMVLVALSPASHTYADEGVILELAFVVPIITRVLWTFGLIIMVNQRLNAENREEIEKQAAQANANTDSLTALANRRYFDEALIVAFHRSQRSGLPLSLIMLDVDYFKKYNDTYGHLAGDDCLRHIGATLKATVGRVTDIVARFGGEEFVALMSETDQHGAGLLAERIRTAVEALAIPHAASSIANV